MLVKMSLLVAIAGQAFFPMPRVTGSYHVSRFEGEKVRAFIPLPLPPANPPLRIEGPLVLKLSQAMTALSRLEVAGRLGPSPRWFISGVVCEEALRFLRTLTTPATLHGL